MINKDDRNFLSIVFCFCCLDGFLNYGGTLVESATGRYQHISGHSGRGLEPAMVTAR